MSVSAWIWKAHIRCERLKRLFGLINICCLNPGIHPGEEGEMVVTRNPTTLVVIFVFVILTWIVVVLRWRNNERKPVFTLDIQVFVLCEVYPWEVIGLCTVQQSPTDSSVCDVKPWAQIAEASILWKFWSPAPPESSSWNWDLTDPHRDQGTPAFTSLWETDYKECSLLCILLIYPFLE